MIDIFSMSCETALTGSGEYRWMSWMKIVILKWKYFISSSQWVKHFVMSILSETWSWTLGTNIIVTPGIQRLCLLNSKMSYSQN